MGRAERRFKERKERIETRKGKLLLSRRELGVIKEKERKDILRYNANSLFTCFALALHRIHGFSVDDISKDLMYIDELMGQINDGKATMEEFIDELEGVGILVQSEN